MEMEDDMEVGLVQQFSCLGTTDKEVLVAQLQKLVGPQLNTSAAHFFLDMNNWNLQLAIGAYFDLTEEPQPTPQHNPNPQINGAVSASQNHWEEEESWEPVEQQQPHQLVAPSSDRASCIVSNYPPRTNAYSMLILQDMSVTEEVIIPPSTKFVKQWKIRNNGNLPWPLGSHLRFISGNRTMIAQEIIVLDPPVQPDECREISVECLAPSVPGNYQICWQMSTPDGCLFGDEIWMICSVGMDMTVDLTKRLQSLSCDNNGVSFSLNPLANGCPSTTNAHQVPTTSAAVVGAGGARGVKTDHKDLIHDVAFDYYGTRMATCSSDQTVRVWELDAGTGNWNCTANWKAHSGSVWKVTWANPEYGQVIATCSFDRTAAVWEEVVGEGSIGDRVSATHWVKRTTLVDSRTSVTDVKFAPRYLGLVLASCSADGFVRIYEAPDVMNLTQWSLQYEIPVKLSCSCIAWNPTYPRHFAPMIAVGTDDSTEDVSKVMIYEFNENLRRWNRIESLQDITDPVNDLSFAPNLGRSHHMLGVASKDLRIVSLEPQNTEDENQGGGPSKIITRTVTQCPDHNSTVWRVAWNVTGTILASSGDDGCVRLWKGNYMGNWKCVTVLRGDGTQANSEPTNVTLAATSSPVGSYGNSRFMKLGAAAAMNKDVVWH